MPYTAGGFRREYSRRGAHSTYEPAARRVCLKIHRQGSELVAHSSPAELLGSQLILLLLRFFALFRPLSIRAGTGLALR
jgi:hypothetical protein